MIKLYKILTLIAISIFVSCSESEAMLNAELAVSKSELMFESTVQAQTIYIKSNTEWKIQSSQAWCIVTPQFGEAGTKPVEVKTLHNSESKARTCSLTLSSGNEVKTIEISQKEKNILEVEQSTYSLSAQAQELEIELTSTAVAFVDVDSYWITLKNEESNNIFIIEENHTLFNRKATVKFTSGNLTEEVLIEQGKADAVVPSSLSGVESNASELATKIGLGWNVGNSLEVPNSETAWGNPLVTEALIQSVKNAGFNAIRIPCAWDSYIVDEKNYEISPLWLRRVKEVVDYCINNEMYAIINIHWDGGWLEENPVYSLQENINKKQAALWNQIAVYFRNYNEHLLFAGTNEVRANYNTPSKENIEVQQSFNQTFVNAVRQTGGKNAHRNLIVQSYNTNINYAVDYFTMPTDEVENRIMLEVHYYDPWEFCGQENGYVEVWNNASWGKEEHLTLQFNKLKTQFVDNGIPVVVGEYGAMYRANLTGVKLENHIKSRNYYLKTVTKTAIENGILPFVWDNGATGNNGFGLFNRTSGEQIHNDAINAIIKHNK